MSDYGSLAGVALIAKKYADASQTFTAITSPTDTEIGTWLDQACSHMNASLADARFSIPITHTAVTPMLDMFINRQVANMVEALNISHRAGPIQGSGRNRSVTVADVLSGLPAAVDSFVKEKSGGLEAMGATRSNVQTMMGSVAMIRVDAYSDDVDSWDSDLT